ncbi:DUF721 domain-containing protein [Qipengyuania sp. MTN3-11]|uniref:DUF721 domain-containing protein n=1 Tax=Qipengyuania sp. MTN3-11 TaxID=3056557 RepID=UPI0036F2CB5B
MERDSTTSRGKPPARTTSSRTHSARKPSAPKPYERPRGGPAKPVGSLMPQIGRTAFRRFGFVQSSVVSRWPEIVGEVHARVCLPESIRFPPGEKAEGILNLVAAPGHATLIQHVIPEIIERVNRFFGYNAVARIKLRQGPVKPPANSSDAKPKAPPSLKPIPMELGDSLRDIGDPELRTVLESLARSLGTHDEERK